MNRLRIFSVFGLIGFKNGIFVNHEQNDLKQ
jgi:hypothetical protein